MIELKGVKYYTIPELSELMNRSEIMLAKQVRAGEIGSVKFGRTRYVNEDHILDYMNKSNKDKKKGDKKASLEAIAKK